MNDLFEDLRRILNIYSVENESNTPDFVLANYLIGCLNNYAEAIKGRDKFHNEHPTLLNEIESANPTPTLLTGGKEG